MTRHLVACLLLLACSGCGIVKLRDPSVPPAARTGKAAPERPPASSAAAPAPALPGVSQATATARVNEALALVDQTRVLVPDWTTADAGMAQARAALAAGDTATAVARASQAYADAEAALSDHYARLAAEELQRSYEFTGLQDEQLVQLRAAEETLVAGNARLAYGRLRTLNSSLSKRSKTYTVAAGDSLWIISGKPEAYANPWLWPLIWRANQDVIANPNRLLRGQVLTLRPHPKLDEVVQALAEARSRAAGVTPQIGEVRAATPP